MIYTNTCEPVEVVAYHGKHGPAWARVKLALLTVRRTDDPGDQFAVFAVSLKADGGSEEIDAAVDAAPEVKLSKDELRKAIKQAE